ncbi:MAG TPA: spore germination protein GerW family protein [Gemmatimonadales bacterium]|nr:spore germination protein GerW family protein [Gemmatimonadales bacterium]
MSTKDLIDSAVEHLRASAGVKTVYGDPVVIDGKTIIPVAKVAYGLGGGTGTRKAQSGNGSKEPAASEAVEGAGGGIAAKPVGVVEISGDETKFVAFAQAKKLAWAAGIASLTGFALGRLLRRRAKD